MNTEVYDGILFKPPIDDFFIEHHGVKGMKWGVRHDRVPVGKRFHDWQLKKNQEAIDRRKAKGKKQTKRQFYIANRDKQLEKDIKRYSNSSTLKYNPYLTKDEVLRKATSLAKRENRTNTNVQYYKKVKKYGEIRAHLAEGGSQLLKSYLGAVGGVAISLFTTVGVMGLGLNYAQSKEYAKGNRKAVANFAANKAVDLLKKVRNSRLARQKMREFSKNVIKIGAKPIVDAKWTYL